MYVRLCRKKRKLYANESAPIYYIYILYVGFAVVGDTFPVGCKFSDTNVFQHTFKTNPDSHNEKYTSKLGVYEEGCGLKNVHMSWGHDEYLYRVCLHNKSTLPPQALYCIRFHSFYPWHKEGGYSHLTDEEDRKMLKWVKVRRVMSLLEYSLSLVFVRFSVLKSQSVIAIMHTPSQVHTTGLPTTFRSNYSISDRATTLSTSHFYTFTILSLTRILSYMCKHMYTCIFFLCTDF